MFKMTPRQALEVQERHIKYYGRLYPGGEEALRAVIKSRTKIEGLDMDTEYCIGQVINRCIPRGGDIEFLVLGKRPRRKLIHCTMPWNMLNGSFK